MVYEAMEEAQNNIIQINYTWTLVHKWFKEDDIRQKMVAYAYKLWWLDFVKLIECENWNWSLTVKWDNWHAHWLCQMNDNFHKDIPTQYKKDRVVAVEYCYKKWKWWTPFYWPSRKMKNWHKCSEYVKDRFILK